MRGSPHCVGDGLLPPPNGTVCATLVEGGHPRLLPRDRQRHLWRHEAVARPSLHQRGRCIVLGLQLGVAVEAGPTPVWKAAEPPAKVRYRSFGGGGVTGDSKASEKKIP